MVDPLRLVPNHSANDDGQSRLPRGDGRCRRIAFVGTYPPRQCGIATFTGALYRAVKAVDGGPDSFVVALNDLGRQYAYDEEVRFQVSDSKLGSHRRAAEYLNFSGVDVVSLQHEYGIFGGRDGEHVLTLLRALKVPVVTTLHTVLASPSTSQRAVLDEICSLSKRIIVMSAGSAKLLQSVHEVNEDDIDLIHHGIHPLDTTESAKPHLGLGDKEVLLTFGLLSPDKGIETVIEALPEIVKQRPNVVYVVLGATHPHVKEREGEAYRLMLEALAVRRGVGQHVIFHDRFVSETELAHFVAAADVYITPYLNLEQSTSGTLAQAVGSGKAVISTPYRYASELLGDGRGILVPVRDKAAMTVAILDVLCNPQRKAELEQATAALGRSMGWEHVARQHLNSYGLASSRRSEQVAAIVPRAHVLQRPSVMPDINLSHVYTLTDETGILQHATYDVPRYSEGYCTDDNARALLLVGMMEQERLESPAELRRLANRYLAFMSYAFNGQNGRFRNFLTYDKRWAEAAGSEDSHGRALWALGAIANYGADPGRRNVAKELFIRALPATLQFSSPRAWAYTLLGIRQWLHAYPVDALARHAARQLGDQLMACYVKCSHDGWRWFENEMTYCNARLPEALIVAAEVLEDEAMLGAGLESLTWLSTMQERDGLFAPIGSNGFHTKDGARARFDQQPVDACATVSACLAAFNQTDHEIWADRAQRAFDWFLGANHLSLWLYDPTTGGCCDGLHEDRLNENQGAEATLSFLHALMSIRRWQGTANWRGVVPRKVLLRRTHVGAT